MTAIAAISLGSVYAGGTIKKMQTDTTKKTTKSDTTKKKPEVTKPQN